MINVFEEILAADSVNQEFQYLLKFEKVCTREVCFF